MPYAETNGIKTYYEIYGSCDRSPQGLRIAWSPTLGYGEPDPQVLSVVSDAVKVLEDLGCQVSEVDKVFDDPLDLMMSEFFAGAGTRLRPVLERSQAAARVGVLLC